MNKNLDNKKEKVIIKQEKKEKSVFVVRAIATVFLILLLVAFCMTGIIYQELGDKKSLFDISGYFSISITMFVLSYCLFELTKSFKEMYKWYIVLIVIVFNAFVFLVYTKLNVYDFLLYENIKISSNWLLNNLFLTTLLVYLPFSFLLGYITTRNLQKTILFFSGSLLILFGMKAFSIFMLSGKEVGSAGRFSYLTVIWIWVIVIFTDTFAYLGGMKFGKNKMAPVISPKKTWEGAFIGCGSATFLGLLLSLLTHFLAPEYQPFYLEILNLKPGWLQVVILVMLSLIFPLIAVLGDLFFSLVKRTVDIKDYSKLIPGHGGLLDRIDSLLAVLSFSFVLIGFYNS